MILIIDSTEVGREQAYKAFRAVDRRRKIVCAETGSSAWRMSVDGRPGMILCADKLPDTTGSELCQRLRQALPFTIYLGYGDENEADGFDGWVRKPPSRFAVISYLSMMKDREKQIRLNQLRNDNALPRSHKHWDPHDVPAKDSQLISVCLEEPNAIRFNVQSQLGFSMKEFLSQLGKKKITGYFLIRRGAKIDADDHTVLVAGDQVVIRTD